MLDNAAYVNIYVYVTGEQPLSCAIWRLSAGREEGRREAEGRRAPPGTPHIDVR